MSKLIDNIIDGKALLKYLPAIYQEDEASRVFLEGFLSIFGSDLQDCEDRISEVPRCIDALSAPEDFLPWLVGWLALDIYEQMGEMNREFIMNAVEIYKWKGTARGLKALVEMLTGGSCTIVEGRAEKSIFRTYPPASDEEKISRTVHSDNIQNMGTLKDDVHYIYDTNLDRLYLRPIVGINVLFEGNAEIKYDNERTALLQRIIESFLPVFVKAEIDIPQNPP